MVFQGSLRSDFQVFKMRFVGVLPKVSQGDYDVIFKRFFRLFNRCLKLVSNVFHGRFKEVSRAFQESVKDVQRKF